MRWDFKETSKIEIVKLFIDEQERVCYNMSVPQEAEHRGAVAKW